MSAAGTAVPVAGGKDDPPETDLDYYSRPENYAGTNLRTMQRVFIAKEKASKNSGDDDGSKANKNSPIYKFFKRYRHIIQPMHGEAREPDTDDEDVADEDEDTAAIAPLPARRHGPKLSLLVPSIPESDTDENEASVGESPEAERAVHLVIKEELGLDEKDSALSLEAVSPPLSATRTSEDDLPEKSGTPELGTSLRQARPSMAGLGARPSVAGMFGARRGTTMVRGKLNTIAQDIRSKAARDRFINFAKKVLIAKKWINAMMQKDAGPVNTCMATFTDLIKEYSYENLRNSGLSFDPSFYKVKKDTITISTEVKTILRLNTEDRTTEQIQTAMYGLQCLRSFAEYPLHMQEKLCKVALYEVVPPKRVIIRQGHLAENFYFILSGQAVVTILVRDPKTQQSVIRTATIMRKGMSFGELALLHHSRRTATVTTQDTVHLLTIGREDFFDIFMAGSGPDEIPDHIKFVTNLEFMKDWPMDKLLEHPEHCLLHFYKRNVVIVKDSRFMDWLYIVKSGSCYVLKQVRGVVPQLGRRRKSMFPVKGKIPEVTAVAKVDTRLGRGHELAAALTKFKSTAAKWRAKGFINFVKTQSVGKAAHRSSVDRRTAYSRWRAKSKKRPATSNDTKPGPVFVQVELLKPRDVFGLNTLQFDDDVYNPTTSVSLVSRGAECVMLSREYFIKQANDHVRNNIRSLTRPYPDEGTFQTNLQIRVDWDLYTGKLIEDITSLFAAQKSVKHFRNV